LKKYIIYTLLILLVASACKSSKKVQVSEDIKTEKKDKPKKSSKSEYDKYSTKFGIQFDGSENLDLLKAIDGWMGVPHKMGGCTKSGVDCSCFVKHIYNDVYGIELTRTSRSMYEESKKVSKGNLKEGDLIFFKINGKTISHVGLYIKNNMFVHASSSRGVVISNLESSYYKQRYFSGGRVKP
jgi:lipoprotein Spr